jgi:EAL domain-containing protein (putative c-di-GMP-specific phosphodiesterase class I)
MIKEILEKELLEIYFQAVVSIRTKKIYAFEALTRCTYKGKYISPDILFSLAEEEGLLYELDTYTRAAAIKKFYNYYKKNKDLILYLNFESKLIDNGVFKKDKKEFLSLINDLDIPPSNFLIEIKEDEISNTQFLIDFCQKYRSLGFSIALDDFGTGSSTFDRINLIKPDIIKIDKSLFIDIKTNHINKEIVKAISSMCHNIGIRVLAEGVEDEVSITTSMKMGINLFQGYFFSKAIKNCNDEDIDNILKKVTEIGNIFKRKTIDSIKNRREVVLKYDLLIENILKKINNISDSNNILKEAFLFSKDIEASYLIDSKTSKQINDTIISKQIKRKFRPSENGDEHYLKEYFYITKESIHGRFLSKKYISYATSNICKTFAKKFLLDDKEYIICVDIVIEGK